jgi:hypothetical protein
MLIATWSVSGRLTPSRPGGAWVPGFRSMQLYRLDTSPDGTSHGARERAVYRVGETSQVIGDGMRLGRPLFDVNRERKPAIEL